MPTYVIVPDADIANGGWDDGSGGTTNLAPRIDECLSETTPSADLIRDQVTPTASTYKASLSNPSIGSETVTSVEVHCWGDTTGGATIKAEVWTAGGGALVVATTTQSPLAAWMTPASASSSLSAAQLNSLELWITGTPPVLQTASVRAAFVVINTTASGVDELGVGAARSQSSTMGQGARDRPGIAAETSQSSLGARAARDLAARGAEASQSKLAARAVVEYMAKAAASSLSSFNAAGTVQQPAVEAGTGVSRASSNTTCRATVERAAVASVRSQSRTSGRGGLLLNAAASVRSQSTARIAASLIAADSGTRNAWKFNPFTGTLDLVTLLKASGVTPGAHGGVGYTLSLIVDAYGRVLEVTVIPIEAESGGAPLKVEEGDVFTIQDNTQVLFAVPIEIAAGAAIEQDGNGVMVQVT